MNTKIKHARVVEKDVMQAVMKMIKSRKYTLKKEDLLLPSKSYCAERYPFVDIEIL